MQISCGLFCNLARLFYHHAPLPNHHDFYILRDWAWPFNNAYCSVDTLSTNAIKFPVRGSTGLNFVLANHWFSKRRCFSLFSLTAPPPTHYVTCPTSSTTVCNTATGVSILELATKVTPVSRLLPRHSKSPSKLSLAVHCEPLID